MNDNNNSIQRSSVHYSDPTSTDRTGSSLNYDPSKPTIRLKVDDKTELMSNLPESLDARVKRHSRPINEEDSRLLHNKRVSILPEADDSSLFNFDSRSSDLAFGNNNDPDTIDV